MSSEIEIPIKYITHNVINGYGGLIGLSIEFLINGVKFTRASEVNSKRLLFWKQNDELYLDENKSLEMEGIIKNFMQGDLFKEQLQLNL